MFCKFVLFSSEYHRVQCLFHYCSKFPDRVMVLFTEKMVELLWYIYTWVLKQLRSNTSYTLRSWFQKHYIEGNPALKDYAFFEREKNIDPCENIWSSTIFNRLTKTHLSFVRCAQLGYLCPLNVMPFSKRMSQIAVSFSYSNK